MLAGVFVAVAAAVSGNTTRLTAIAKLSEPPTWYIVSTLLGLWAGFFGSAWLATGVRGTKSFRRDLGLRFRWIDLVGIPIGVGGQFLVALIYIPISHHVHDFNQRFDAPSQRLTGGSHGASFVVIAVFTVVGAPFFEELFFRGVLLRSWPGCSGPSGDGWGRRWPSSSPVCSSAWPTPSHSSCSAWPPSGSSCRSSPTGPAGSGMNMVAHASFNLVAVAATAVIGPLALVHGVAVLT